MRRLTSRFLVLLTAALALGLCLALGAASGAPAARADGAAGGHITVMPLATSQLATGQTGLSGTSLCPYVPPITALIADGVPFTGPVATFTDAATNPAPFTVTISWGDGASGAAEKVTGPDANGVYTVYGNHTYADEGPETVTVSITDSTGASALSSTQFTVSEGDICITNPAMAPTEGTAFGGTVLSFADPSSADAGADYTATINWGDNTPATAGTVTGGAGSYAVTASETPHTYADEGTYTAIVTVSEAGVQPNPLFTARVTVNVAEGDSFGTPALSLPDATEGTAVAVGAVSASFPDTGYATNSADFSATINWGDDTTSTGTVSGPVGGVYTVTNAGTHTYADEGSYNVSVSLSDDGSGTAGPSVSGSITVGEGDSFSFSTMINGATEGKAVTGAVLTFADTGYPANTAADFTASIDWGDGTTTAGTVSNSCGLCAGHTATLPSSALYSVYAPTGGHTYADESSPTVTVKIYEDNNTSTPFATFTNVVTVGEGDTMASPTIMVSGATEGQAVSGTVATFADSGYPANSAADFTATINWGDGSTPAAGTVSGPTGGVFTISAPTGGHTYAQDGAYTLSVSYSEDTPSATPVTATGTVNVAEDSSFSVTVGTGTITEGTAYSGQVATFSDTGSDDAAGGYAATIQWGDGNSSAGTVTGSAGSYSVSASGAPHTYAEEGPYTITVSVTENTDTTPSLPFTAQAQATVRVVQGDSFTTAMKLTSATEGQAASGAVATFNDTGYPTNSAADFSATIIWGDGSTSTGTVSGPVDGVFTVNGGHTYADEGSYNAIVSLFEDGGSITCATPVSNSCAIATASGGVTVNEGDRISTASLSAMAPAYNVPFSGQVASFTDPTNSAADFAATIIWGDGSVSTGTVSGPAGGTYKVYGSHTYTSVGPRFLIVVLFDGTAASSSDSWAAAGSITVAKAPTSVALTSSPNAPMAGQPVTLSATVRPAGGGVPTGTVTFADSTNGGSTFTTLGSGPVTLVNGAATLTVSALSAGNHVIRASYSGDTNFLPSSTTINQVVGGCTVKGSAAGFSAQVSNNPSFTAHTFGASLPNAKFTVGQATIAACVLGTEGTATVTLAGPVSSASGAGYQTGDMITTTLTEQSGKLQISIRNARTGATVPISATLAQNTFTITSP